MKKKIRFKPKDAELWKRIEAVYPGKSAEYKKELYDLLCPESRIAALKHHVSILENIDTLKERYLKKLAKDRSAKGGKASKKEPSFALLVQYAWEKSKRKTCLSMWKFLERKLQAGDVSISGYDFVYEEETNRITLYFGNGKSRDIGFRSFQRYVKDFKEGLKDNCQ